MNEGLYLAAPLAAGFVLGVLFFGGLRWTVSRGVASTWPALWFGGSMLLRMGVALPGFYIVGREDWRRWLACLAGFVVARLVVQRLTRSAAEARHAP